MVQERSYTPMSGWGPLLIALGLIFGVPAYCIYSMAQMSGPNPWLILLAIGSVLTGFIGLFGMMAVAPNDSRVLLLFGEYKGSVTKSGFYWVNPFFTKKKLSLRVRNFETGSLETPQKTSEHGVVLQQKSRSSGRPSKVNDKDGNPIEISAVVVWKVVNTAEALFEVDDYEHFVAVQSEAALRNLASRHPYDSEDHETSLRGNAATVCEDLQKDIQERLDTAGVQVLEARISHLAYAPEIASAMLQRQQAQAVIAARTKIVEGAVSMVDMALKHLEKDNIVHLDEERRAAMVSNLLVVLCSDRHTQPVVNAGSLYN